MTRAEASSAESRMMTRRDDEEVRAVLRGTITRVAGTDAEAVILFGSQAPGDARPDSDWDVLVLTGDGADAVGLHIARQRELCEVAVELGIKVQPLVLRWSEIHDNAHLMRNVANEGVPL